MTKSVNITYRFEYFPQGQLVNTGMSKITSWYVRLRRVENGEILMVSESYSRRSSAKRAAIKMAKAFGASVLQADA